MRVHPTPAGAELFVDALPRGPATEGQLVELSAGLHVAELRRDGRVLVSMPVEIRPALIFDVELTAPEEPPFDDGVDGPPEVPDVVAEPEVAEPEVAEPEVADPEVADPDVAGLEPETIPPAIDPSPLQPPTPGAERSSTAVGAVIHAGQHEIRACYEQGLRAGTLQTGAMRLDVRAIIAPSGRASTVSMGGGVPASLSSCVARVVRGWDFGAASEPMTVTFPLIFDSQ